MINYDESVSGDISSNPDSPLAFTLAEGSNTISATTGNGEQEYVTLTVPEGFQLDSVVLESYTPNDVGFIGLQQGTTFTEPLDDSAIRGNILGYTLFGNPRQIGTDILDEIGNGLNAIGFEGSLPSGDYTFAIQQLGAESDYTLAFNVSEVAEALPVVSFEAIPSTISEEASAEDRLLILQWTVTGEVPEEGLVVNFDNLFGITAQLDGEDDRQAGNNIEFANFDVANNRIGLRLLANEASFALPVGNDLIEETTVFDFILSPGDGYIVDPERNSTLFTITDDNGGPGVGPTISLSVSETNLAEGDQFTVNFTSEDEIPAGGVELLVESSLGGALGLFDLADLGSLSLTGIDGLPRVGDTRGNSFIVNIVDPNASITLSVFDNIVAEETREAPFTLLNGELYEVDPDAADVTLSISDQPQPVGPTVSFTVDNTAVFEGDTITLTFDVEGEIPAEGVTVLVNDVASAQSGLRSLTEFDIGSLELAGISGFPLPAEGDSGFFVTIAEPTATITLPIFDEGADEDETTEIFTFEVIDGEAYEVNPDAGSATIRITDVGDTPFSPAPIVGFSIDRDLISEEDDNTIVTTTFNVEGDIPTPEFDADGNLVSGGLSILYQGPLSEFLGEITDNFNFNSLLVGSFVDPVQGIFELILLDNTASAELEVLNDVVQEADQEYAFTIIENDGLIDSNYAVDPNSSSDAATLIDGNGGPGVGPTVGISLTETELSEGGEFTVNFDVDGEIPDGGVTVLVDNDVFGALGEFSIFDADGNPAFSSTGIAGIPEVGDIGASSFLVNIIEPNASITLSVFDDGPNEGLEEFTFNVIDGEIYEVDADAGTVSFSIDDGGIIGDTNLLDTAFNRFQNSSIPGTYVYATGAEADSIRDNLPGFVDEGMAFSTAIAPNDDLIALNRLESNQLPGTFLYVGEEELANINADPNFSNAFTDQGVAFYVYGAGAGVETTFNRFQNTDVPGTYLYATGAEADSIRANFPGFIDEGVAFEALI